tara:strand:- start:472 stop:678 length:207 start_codon:yes stop_codon:yes gene_type:complete
LITLKVDTAVVQINEDNSVDILDGVLEIPFKSIKEANKYLNEHYSRTICDRMAGYVGLPQLRLYARST